MNWSSFHFHFRLKMVCYLQPTDGITQLLHADKTRRLFCLRGGNHVQSRSRHRRSLLRRVLAPLEAVTIATGGAGAEIEHGLPPLRDRKSTGLNSRHVAISY